MEQFSEEVQSKNKVRFTIHSNGRSIEVNAENLDEYQVAELLDPVRREAKYQRQEHLQSVTNNIMMHCIAIAFLTLVVTGGTFTISRLVSTMFNQPRVQGVTNVN
jgi:hypothetical protein